MDPPKALVVQGLHRFVGNPMYLRVMTLVSGEEILTRPAALLLYLAIFFLAASLFMIGYEEPVLRRTFGVKTGCGRGLLPASTHRAIARLPVGPSLRSP